MADETKKAEYLKKIYANDPTNLSRFFNSLLIDSTPEGYDNLKCLILTGLVNEANVHIAIDRQNGERKTGLLVLYVEKCSSKGEVLSILSKMLEKHPDSTGVNLVGATVKARKDITWNDMASIVEASHNKSYTWDLLDAISTTLDERITKVA